MSQPSTAIDGSSPGADQASPGLPSSPREPPLPLALQRAHQSYHRAVLLGAALVLLAAVCLERNDSDSLQLPGMRFRLPTLCWSRGVFGMDCPGCGLTRAFVCLGHGELRAAWRYNPAALPMFAIVASQIPWRLVQLARIARGVSPLHGSQWSTAIVVGMVVLLFAQWIFRIVF